MTHNEKQLSSVSSWLSTDLENIKFNEVEDVDISNFKEDIESLLEKFKDYPKDMFKVDHIIAMIKKNKEIYPVYIEKDDPFNFVFNGRYRMVALYLLGFKKIPVCYVELKNKKKC